MSQKVKPLLKGDRGELGQYVRDIADQMGLRDWTVNMMHGEPANVKAGADCQVVFGQKVVDIRFRHDWHEMPPEDLRWLVAHELVHCHLWTMSQRVCDLESTMGVMVWGVFDAAFTDALEHATDGIAREWSRHLPLPVKRKKAA